MAEFLRLKERSGFRSMAIGMWHIPREPVVFVRSTVDARPMLKVIDDLRKKGVRATPTHFVIKASARAMEEYSHLNLKLEGHRLYSRKDVNVFVLTDINGKDVGGFLMRSPAGMSIADISRTARKMASEVKAEKDREFGPGRRMLSRVPGFMLWPVLKIADFLTNTLGRDAFSMPSDPFGSIIVSNVGMYDVEEIYSPLFPLGRAPVVIVMTTIRKTPVVDGDKVVVAEAFNLCYTFDHRITDGRHMIGYTNRVRALLESPEDLL